MCARIATETPKSDVRPPESEVRLHHSQCVLPERKLITSWADQVHVLPIIHLREPPRRTSQAEGESTLPLPASPLLGPCLGQVVERRGLSCVGVPRRATRSVPPTLLYTCHHRCTLRQRWPGDLPGRSGPAWKYHCTCWMVHVPRGCLPWRCSSKAADHFAMQPRQPRKHSPFNKDRWRESTPQQTAQLQAGFISGATCQAHTPPPVWQQKVSRYARYPDVSFVIDLCFLLQMPQKFKGTCNSLHARCQTRNRLSGSNPACYI